MVQNTTEVLEEPFEIRSGVVIPIGEYNFTGFRAMVDMPESRMISGGMAVVTVRRIMQTIGFGGIACALFVVGSVETVWIAIAIMTVGNTLGAAVTGGFAVNHMDVAPRYAGTLMGITNTAGTIPGIIGVTITGVILEQTGSWALVFGVAGGVALFGLVFFLIFARGTEQVA